MSSEPGVLKLVGKGVNEGIREIIDIDLSRPVVLGMKTKVTGVEGGKTCPYFMNASKWDNIC